MQQNPLLEHLIYQESASARQSIIWLHGLGARCDDFYPIAGQLALRPDTQIIFPQAPSRPVGINGGYVMPAWYDILSLDFEQRGQDVAGIAASMAAVELLAERERTAGRSVHVVGFSQGAAMALALMNQHDYASAAILSGYALAELKPDAAKPILHQHGEWDEVVLCDHGEKAYRAALAAGYASQWQSYPMGHAVSPAQIQDLAAWLRQQGL